MTKNEMFVEKKIANLVTRRDYSKQEVKFDEPDLLEIQRESYKHFLKKDLGQFIASYFPITHIKNRTHIVKFNGIHFYPGAFNEIEARTKGKTYYSSLYADLILENIETGEIKKVKKSKNDKHDGVFFANIPLMAKNGTFIINGVEKFVISQTIRSPGAYILTSSKIKLVGKKKVNQGYVCELYPNHGTMMNFWVDDKKLVQPIVKVVARNISSDAAVTFSATQLLKALGLSQEVILDIFGDTEIINNSLVADRTPKSYSPRFEGCYHHEVIAENHDIKFIINQVEKEYNKLLKANQEQAEETKSSVKKPTVKDMVHKGLPIDRKIHELIWVWVNELKPKNLKIAKALENDPNNEKLKQEYDASNKELRAQVDLIITEKAAMDVVNILGMSKRATEQLSLENPGFCYHDYLVRHFLNKKGFDLSMAGRSKINHKMRVSERLYHKVLAKDILTKSGKVLLKKGTLITKDELNIFKQNIDNLAIEHEWNLLVHSKFAKYKTIKAEVVSVYPDNNKWDEFVNIIGVGNKATETTLNISDIIAMISYTINLPWNIGSYDDIDHLGNKRLRLIHEQFESKLVAGMARVEKHIKDKLASLSTPTMNEEQKAKKKATTTIKSIVNTKPFQQVVKAFFNSYQLTQFIDQQNPLSELTNKRRISAMGDGGIRREDPNLDVRDVHYSHYGRICPIETPEGMNIGLIMSLACFAKVDENGFIITPYFKVKDGIITNEIKWLNASQEDEYVIAESSLPHDENGKIKLAKVVGRYRGMQELYLPKEINYIDVSPRQVISIAASAIPFLENDDTARALMGSNMQRQAVPLLKPYAPIVGTGSEYKIAHDSGLSVVADNDGEVISVDGNNIVVKNKEGKLDKYHLIKYRKTNQNTCNNQIPIVEVGQSIKANQILADGPAMSNGELAIGRNPIIAYTTWHGYNFEDAIIVSSKLVQDDWYTSISIEEYTCTCVTTKNGDEEISRDLPNVSDDVKNYLDEDGIIMIGAEVKQGDILVGRISPKGQVDYSPEEKLLNAIFGNKSHGYKDSSLRVEYGGDGIVIGVNKFRQARSIDDTEPDSNGFIPTMFDDETIFMVKVYVAQKRKLQIGDKMSGRHGNKGTISKIVPVEDMPYMQDGTPIDILLSPLGVPSRMNIGQILEVHLGWAMRNLAKKKLWQLLNSGARNDDFVQLFGINPNKAEILRKTCKKYFAQSNIKSYEKFTNVDLTIILQLSGLTIEDLGYKASTPVFSGAKLNDIAATLKEADLDPAKDNGKTQLYDGQTGQPFDATITVGVMYMLKLDHMVDDKIHARSIGPYSKVNQQPLGGRSQNGGQRFGEMEVWALEAYGAAYNLREILTVKSDDTVGRNYTYNAIVRGRKLPVPSLPESFKLLTKQLQGLCLCMTVIDQDGTKHDMNDYATTSSIEEDIKNIEKEADEIETVETFDQGEYNL